jgi:hypothetical protein
MSSPITGPPGLKSPLVKSSDLIHSPTAMEVIDEEEWEGFLVGSASAKELITRTT